MFWRNDNNWLWRIPIWVFILLLALSGLCFWLLITGGEPLWR